MRLRHAVIAAAVAVPLLVAAVVFVPQRLDRSRAVSGVRAYDDALVVALAKLDPGRLGDVATDRQRSKVTTYITYLWGSGVYMEATLLSLESKSVKRERSGLTVVVREDWRHQKRDRGTRQTVGGGERSSQTVRYVLVERGGRLFVDDVEVLAER